MHIIHDKMTNEREIFYLKTKSSTNYKESDLIFFIKLQGSFVHGILHFAHSLSEEKIFPIVAQIIRECIPSDINEKNYTEIYRKFWKNVISKSNENDIRILGFYLEIIDKSSEVPEHLFSKTTK